MSEQAPQVRIANHEQNVAAHQRHQRQAVEAARRLAALDPAASGKVWAGPIADWSKNRDSALALARKLPASEDAARQARAELDMISQRHSELEPVAKRGEAADAELHRRVEEYLDAVIDADQFPPMWFDLALGPGIPRRNWREWRRTAVEVIRYRIVYGISDKMNALGEPPADQEQLADYERLTADCATYRR